MPPSCCPTEADARARCGLVDGRITDIAPRARAYPPGAVDCDGDLVMPGLIELHTDNLERHIEPRPKVGWPHAAAIIAHDAELASVGITTVFDALRVGSVVSNTKANYGEYARVLADEILGLRDGGALKISHFLHLRAEVCSETLVAEMAKFGPPGPHRHRQPDGPYAGGTAVPRPVQAQGLCLRQARPVGRGLRRSRRQPARPARPAGRAARGRRGGRRAALWRGAGQP